MKAPTSIMPSDLLSCPSSARTKGSMSAIHIMNLLFVKMFGSNSIFLPNMHSNPSASAACTMFVPSIAPSPMFSCPDRNPVSELIISGADAAMATTTSPMIASLNPSLLA